MPIYPNLVERFALRRNLAPGAGLDLLGSTAFSSAMLAVDLGIFEHLKASSLDCSQISAATGCSKEAMERLLRYLVATGYLSVGTGDRYSNTRLTNKFLVGSPNAAVARLWNRFLSTYWDRDFADAVRYGKPVRPLGEWLSSQSDGWEIFNAAMKSLAQEPALEVAKRVKLPSGARRLLDLGGNHGLYSLAFCNNYPELESIVFDLPAALKDNLHTLQGRVKPMAGDVRTDPFGSGYDAILISNLLHYFEAPMCQDILVRAANALNNGGILIINEQLAGSNKAPLTNAFLRMVSLHYMLVVGSDAHSLQTISNWMHAASFAAVEKMSLKSAPGQQILIAKKGNG